MIFKSLLCIGLMVKIYKAVMLWGYKLASWLPWRKELFHMYNIYNYRVHFHQAIYQCTRMFDILVSMLMFAMSKNYLDRDHS